MADLLPYQYALIALIFVWGGFVRSGLGFGGAVLTLPFLLLILNEPLVFLPIVAIHLLVFSGLTVYQAHRIARARADGARQPAIEWGFVRYALSVMIIPKIISIMVIDL